MYAAGIIGGVVVLILGSLVKRLMELRATPWLLWPVILVAGAAPAYVTYDVLHPRYVTDAEGREMVQIVEATEFDYAAFGQAMRTSDDVGPKADRKQFPVQVLPTALEAEPQAPAHPDQDASLVQPAESDFSSEAEFTAATAQYESERSQKMTEYRAAVKEFQEAKGVWDAKKANYDKRNGQYQTFKSAMEAFQALSDDEVGRQIIDTQYGGLDSADMEVVKPYLTPAEGKSLSFAIPETGEYSIMVTALLGEYDPDDPASEKTSYALEIGGTDASGVAWSQNHDGVIRRDTAGSGPDVALTEGEGISETGTRRGNFGEDLQDRYELTGNGETTIKIANWDPTDGQGAAEALEFRVVQAPPSRTVMWGLACFMTLLCFFMEVYYGCDRISNDIAFLMVWAVALRDGVTPLDDWQRIGSAMLPALLVGFLGVAGVSYVLNKYVTSKDAAGDGQDGAPTGA